MRTRYIFIIAFGFAGVFAAIGLFNSENCSQIGACRNCWSASAAEVTSDLCPTKEPCTAQPYLQQRNAAVDTLVCACTNAKTASYQDAGLNKQIEDAYFAMLGGCTDEVLAVPAETREARGIFCLEVERVSTKDLCDSPGQYLSKRPYG
jgi:hypothetical protein